MFRYKNWTENELKSSKCPKKNFKDLKKAWRTTARDYFRKVDLLLLQGSKV